MKINFDGYNIGYTADSDLTGYDYILRKANELKALDRSMYLYINTEFMDLLYAYEPTIAFRIEDKKPIKELNVKVR